MKGGRGCDYVKRNIGSYPRSLLKQQISDDPTRVCYIFRELPVLMEGYLIRLYTKRLVNIIIIIQFVVQ